jgi:polyketide biosynthesis acyl carrier protein
MKSQEMFDLIVARTREVLPELAAYPLRNEDDWAQLGANSVDRAEIVTLIAESLGLRVSRVELFGPRNLGELAELLHEKCSLQ